jgi:hypothetical protein
MLSLNSYTTHLLYRKFRLVAHRIEVVAYDELANKVGSNTAVKLSNVDCRLEKLFLELFVERVSRHTHSQIHDELLYHLIVCYRDVAHAVTDAIIENRYSDVENVLVGFNFHSMHNERAVL